MRFFKYLALVLATAVLVSMACIAEDLDHGKSVVSVDSDIESIIGFEETVEDNIVVASDIDIPLESASDIDLPECVHIDNGLIELNVSGEQLLFPSSLRLGVKESFFLGVKDATFKSSRKSVATIDRDGIITARKTGTSIITVSIRNKTVGTCKVTVLNAPRQVAIKPATLVLFMGTTRKLNATLPPKTASNKLRWKSSNRKVVTVDENGIVTPVMPGTTNVSVTTYNNKKAICTVTVNDDPISVSFPSKAITIGVGEHVIVRPEINKGAKAVFTWASMNDYIAKVDESGKITGLQIGSTTITVRTQNGLSSKLKVSILNAPTNISINETASVKVGQTIQLKARLPKNSASYILKWKSSDTRIATVDEDGIVTGLIPGNVKISVSTYNKQLSSCSLTVEATDAVPVFDLSNLNWISGRSGLGDQDIAIHNGTVFGFTEGIMYVNGKDYPIINGHGNNCMFGQTLHGEYPYLYCGSWNRNSCAVFVNQITSEGASLVRTIHYPLTGYLNCCVDEDNRRIYILLNISEKTRQGIVDFIVSDLDGQIISRSAIEALPVVQGMTYHNHRIYVVSGFGNGQFPNVLSVFSTSGKLVAQNKQINVKDEIEGIDFDSDTLYIATRYSLYRK